MALKPARAAIYARISQDDSGSTEGVGRQIDDARALAESGGSDVVEMFTDNDESAYSGARRPGYQALTADVEAGEVARRLGDARSTVYALVLVDWLPNVYVDGRFFVPDSALDKAKLVSL